MEEEKERMELLKKLGINYEKYPHLLRIPKEYILKRIEFLKNLGIDYRKYMLLLTYSEESILEKLELLKKLGFQMDEIRENPFLLSYSGERFKEMIEAEKYFKTKIPKPQIIMHLRYKRPIDLLEAYRRATMERSEKVLKEVV
jgi:hypothetical protein